MRAQATPAHSSGMGTARPFGETKVGSGGAGSHLLHAVIPPPNTRLKPHQRAQSSLDVRFTATWHRAAEDGWAPLQSQSHSGEGGLQPLCESHHPRDQLQVGALRSGRRRVSWDTILEGMRGCPVPGRPGKPWGQGSLLGGGDTVPARKCPGQREASDVAAEVSASLLFRDKQTLRKKDGETPGVTHTAGQTREPTVALGMAPGVCCALLDVSVNAPNAGLRGRAAGGASCPLFSSEGSSWGFFAKAPVLPPPWPSPPVFRATELSLVGGQPRSRLLSGDLGLPAMFPAPHCGVALLSPLGSSRAGRLPSVLRSPGGCVAHSAPCVWTPVWGTRQDTGGREAWALSPSCSLPAGEKLRKALGQQGPVLTLR